MYASDVKHSSPRLEEKLAHIYTLGRKVISFDFRPEFLDLLTALGNPHKKLPPVIHVAGTNGKGSIVATLRSILQEEGYKVHAYTSPHLIAFNERIVLAGKQITDDFLESLIDEALGLNAGHDITFFELTTALAFAAFSRVPADVLILEVGLGGRMDCTNIVEKPLVSIINSIGFDHMEFLGDTIEKIAAEKGGIIKPGVPVVISAQNHEPAKKTLESIARTKGAPLARHGADWVTTDLDDVFKFVHKGVEMTLPRPNLQGAHQVTNSGAAIAALQLISQQLPVSETAISKGLQKIQWAARLQNLTKHFDLPKGWELWLDGGHNEDAARSIAQWAGSKDMPVHLIIGMLYRKDPGDFVRILQNSIASITCIDIPDEPQSWKSSDMRMQLKRQFTTFPIAAHSSLRAAMQPLISAHFAPGCFLVTGSLYLAGHVLKTCRVQP